MRIVSGGCLLWPRGTQIDVAGKVYAIAAVVTPAELALTASFRGVTGAQHYRLPHADITLGQAEGFAITDDDLETENSGQTVLATNSQAIPANFPAKVEIRRNWIGDTKPGIVGTFAIWGDLHSSVVVANSIYGGQGAANTGVAVG